MSVYHVTKVPLERSSRVLSQIDLAYSESKVIFLDDFFSKMRFILDLKGETIIFHQQASLLAMILTIIFNIIKNNKNNIIYDMHDLVIFDYAGIFMRLRACLIFILEKIAMLFNIKVITVSHGLAKVIKKRYNKNALVVYNFPKNYVPRSGNRKKDSNSNFVNPCYFGIIDEKRIPLKIFEEISNKSLKKIDVYGYVNSISKFSFSNLNFLNYKGKFSPENMDFLKEYNLLLFVTDKSLNLNYKYCMPNKVFQAVNYGLNLLVSDFFEEIISTFNDAIEPYFFASEINGLKYLSCVKVSEKLDDLFLISQRNFLSIVGDLK